MNIKIARVLSIVIICASSCTTRELRNSTFNQSKTVNDLLADQVLYNLALYKGYYQGTNFNGLPAFVTLASGQAQIQDSVTPTFSAALTTHASTGNPTYTPQIAGTHQVQDNWSFTPIVDPSVLFRLYWLYKVEFKPIGEAGLTNIFPPIPDLDQWGRPNLKYVAKAGPDGRVQTDANHQPLFDIFVKEPVKHKLDEIPGSINEDLSTNWSWFSFSPPCAGEKWDFAGTFLKMPIWITSRSNFVKFALLTMGGTNAPSTTPISSSPMLFLNQNGLITVPR